MHAELTSCANLEGFDPLNQLVNVVMVLGAPSVYDLWTLQADDHRLSFPDVKPLSFSASLPGMPAASDMLGTNSLTLVRGRTSCLPNATRNACTQMV
jgi:hypothetical protein